MRLPLSATALLPTTFATVILISLVVLSTSAAGHKKPPPENVVEYGQVVPMGDDALLLKPLNKVIYLFASALSPEFAGLRLIESSGKKFLLNRKQQLVSTLPRDVTFRVTASTKSKLLDVAPFPVHSDRDLNSYLLGLKFKIKVFHGLDEQEIEPLQMKLIGLPKEVVYEERVYNISVKLDKVAARDHLVLEVWSPDGNQRVSKLHLDLM